MPPPTRSVFLSLTARVHPRPGAPASVRAWRQRQGAAEIHAVAERRQPRVLPGQGRGGQGGAGANQQGRTPKQPTAAQYDDDSTQWAARSKPWMARSMTSPTTSRAWRASSPARLRRRSCKKFRSASTDRSTTSCGRKLKWR